MEKVKSKPVVTFKGKNGNVFNLMGICTSALKINGQREESKRLVKRVVTSKSYEDALSIMGEYVQIR